MLRTLAIDLLTVLLLPWFALSRFWRRTDPEKLLIIQLGKIGDMVCTTPLFRAIHAHDPQMRVTVLCLDRAAAVLENNPCVHEVLRMDDDVYSGFRGRVRFFLLLRRQGFGISIAVLPGTLNAVIGLWTGAPVSVHSRNAAMGPLGKFLHQFHTGRIDYRRHTRTFDHYMAIAAMLGVKPVPYQHEIHLTEDERKAGDRWIADHQVSGRFVVLSLTAGNVLKEWPLERFVGVAKALAVRNLTIVFSSADIAVTRRASDQSGSGAIDAGGLPLRTLAAVIAQASLFVSVDTGPLYIAHALGVPLVDITGPVDPAEQPPVPGPAVALVLPPPSIMPSSFVADTLRTETPQQRDALEKTTADTVLTAAEELLQRGG